jgi:hypothetical protein
MDRTRLSRVNFHENEERPERGHIQVAWREKMGNKAYISTEKRYTVALKEDS